MRYVALAVLWPTIGIDDLNGLWGPAERLGTLDQSLLQPEAVLMAQRLMGGRLSAVEDRFAGQMLGG